MRDPTVVPRREAFVWARLSPAFLIAAAVIFIYAPALRGEWLFDDDTAIVHRAVIHQANGLWRIWFAPTGTDYFPLRDTVQWLQWHLFGEATLGYHLTNVALHLASCLLLWRVLAQLGVRAAWLGGLIFAVHPVAVESVAWISELKNTLSLPLLLAAFLAYVEFDRERRFHVGLRAFALYLAALLSKSSVVMFPAVLLLYAWWKRGRISAADVWAALPYFAASLLIGVITLSLQNQPMPGLERPEWPGLAGAVLRAAFIVAFYLGKCAWPVDQSILYPRWEIAATAPWEVFLLLLLIGFSVWLATRRTAWSRHALFGWLFFLLNLAPVLGFAHMTWMSFAWVSDHLVYLPLIGLVGLATAALGDANRRWPGARGVSHSLVAIVLAAYAWQSHQTARLFSSSYALWAHCVALNPESWLAHNHLGVALVGRGDHAGGMAQFAESIALHPHQWLAYVNRGDTRLQLGAVDGAIDDFRCGLAQCPDDPAAHDALAAALMRAGRYDDAAREYRRTFELDPTFGSAASDLTAALLQAGRIDDALAAGREAVRFAPDSSLAHYNEGLALGAAGRFAEAADEFAAASKLDPTDPDVFQNLGVALARAGRAAAALAAFEKSRELKAQQAKPPKP